MQTPVIRRFPGVPTHRRLTGLEHIRSKRHSPNEMRRRAAIMRSLLHWGYADLLEAEADARAVANGDGLWRRRPSV